MRYHTGNLWNSPCNRAPDLTVILNCMLIALAGAKYDKDMWFNIGTNWDGNLYVVNGTWTLDVYPVREGKTQTDHCIHIFGSYEE